MDLALYEAGCLSLGRSEGVEEGVLVTRVGDQEGVLGVRVVAHLVIRRPLGGH